ncbi:MAG: hypothetical protein WB773_04520 [Isosphaeraceae bacterium]
MSALIEAPIEMVEAVAGLHLPPRADQRLQDLMNRNTTVRLTVFGFDASCYYQVIYFE